MKILVYKYWSGNAYCERIESVLRRLGHAVIAGRRPGPLKWSRARPDCVWLNAPEQQIVSDRSHHLRPLRTIKLLSTLLVMRLRGVLLVSVEHNHAAHNAGAVVGWVIRRVLDLIRRLANVRITHAVTDASTGPGQVHYVPHPLYRISPAVAVPAAFAAEPRCVIIGRIMPYKRLEETLQWWPAGAPLRIVGSATNDGYLRKLRGIAAGREIEFQVGALAPEALDRVLADHDIVVVPNGRSSNVVSGTFYHAISAGCLVLARSAGYLETLSASGFPHLELYDSGAGLADALARLGQKSRQTSRRAVQADAEARFGDAQVTDAIARVLAGSYHGARRTRRST